MSVFVGGAIGLSPIFGVLAWDRHPVSMDNSGKDVFGQPQVLVRFSVNLSGPVFNPKHKIQLFTLL
jgi:hypothetical protein